MRNIWEYLVLQFSLLFVDFVRNSNVIIISSQGGGDYESDIGILGRAGIDNERTLNLFRFWNVVCML